MEEARRLMTADEVAEVLRVSRLRVYELARIGAIPTVRMGRQIRFAPGALNQWMAQGGTSLDEVRPGFGR